MSGEEDPYIRYKRSRQKTDSQVGVFYRSFIFDISPKYRLNENGSKRNRTCSRYEYSYVVRSLFQSTIAILFT